MQTRNLTFVAMLLLASCVAPPPPPAQRAAPVPPPVAAQPALMPRLSADWNDWPFSVGDWVYRRDDRGSIALFGPAGQNAVVSLRCDLQNRRIYVSREATAPGQRIVIRTSSSTKEFAAKPTGGTPAYLATEIMPMDAILDAMAFSRGRILLETDGHSPIILPAWAEIARVVEDCRY
jgi:hypothetical protein